MLSLYPNIKPYASHWLAVDKPHELYVEECGSPGGIPVLCLHGGPGAGCDPIHRRYFDPLDYRIVLFDQRGSGRSRPHASLEENTTEALIRDIETLREFLGVRRWVLFGGSWGATLALLYAERFPERVMAMILRGVFLCRREDIDWLYKQGARSIFPDHWADFVRLLDVDQRQNVIAAYYERLTGKDEVARLAAAKAWTTWEARCATLVPSKPLIDQVKEAHTALSMARIECHYLVNNGFLEPDQILRDIAAVAEIPGIIVHGRYDMICPLTQAWALHDAWPRSKLRIINHAGHSASEPGIVDALIHATKDIARDLQ